MNTANTLISIDVVLLVNSAILADIVLLGQVYVGLLVKSCVLMLLRRINMLYHGLINGQNCWIG